GGEPGARGRDLLDGELLPGKVTGTLRAGQRLRMETPGGGGYGAPRCQIETPGGGGQSVP
ncbi:MAG TPA: hydantoinase B/oxoprolinase family protein, partial [Solirubrobacteraceae bacterium]|nr:hydantoinase B/oxoprolinase family protein [Solirubrobacteraceae bacterium]